jgi:hypothetical protein
MVHSHISGSVDQPRFDEVLIRTSVDFVLDFLIYQKNGFSLLGSNPC